MRLLRRLVAVVLACLALTALAQDVSLLPKYGGAPKTTAQKEADARFIAAMDAHFKGDRKAAAEEAARRGWEAVRKGNSEEGMRRFNQAWLLDPGSGQALWGMGAIESQERDTAAGLRLFREAEATVGNDVEFGVDIARAVGFAGAEQRDPALLREAFMRFERMHRLRPQHTNNLQYHTGNYAEAWQKVKLAEATPGRATLDASFLAALQAKMPRP